MSSFCRILFLSIAVLWAPLSHAQAKDTTTILLFGDSIIAGYGLNAAESLPAQLQSILHETHPGITVINGGVSGDTTSGGRSRLAWTLDKHKPDMVILALGGNDVLRGLPPSVTKDNVSAMLKLLAQRNIPTVLSAVQAPDSLGGEYSAAFNAIYPEAAKQFDVPLYPFLITDTFGQKDRMQPDGIHPSAAGARLIAEALADYLRARPPLNIK